MARRPCGSPEQTKQARYEQVAQRIRKNSLETLYISSTFHSFNTVSLRARAQDCWNTTGRLRSSCGHMRSANTEWAGHVRFTSQSIEDTSWDNEYILKLECAKSHLARREARECNTASHVYGVDQSTSHRQDRLLVALGSARSFSAAVDLSLRDWSRCMRRCTCQNVPALSGSRCSKQQSWSTDRNIKSALTSTITIS